MSASIVNAKNQKAASFVELLLSEEGQQILLDPKIRACRCGSPPTTRRRPAIPIRSGRLDRLQGQLHAELSEGRL